MAGVVDAPRLQRSWRIRFRAVDPADPDLLRLTEACLAELERLGREAFNVHAARYDEPAAQPVRDVVHRLWSLGATSGISHEPCGAAARVEFAVEPAAATAD
jgi:hypothetical protein